MPIRSRTVGSRIADILIYAILAAYAVATVLPMIYVFAGSFATSEELAAKGFLLFPSRFSLAAYRYIFSTDTMVRSFGVTVLITVTGTLVNIAMTGLMAYPLAHTDIAGRKLIISLVTFTLIFGGGMIPGFLVVKSLKLINTFWSLIIPGAISTFNLIVLKNFFQQIPAELEESARMDGAHELSVLSRIVLPLSAPAIATFSLFYAVGHWNSFFSAILYISDSRLWPIQVILRQIIMLSQSIGDLAEAGEVVPPPQETIQLAVIVVATAPILAVYPFLQKHFVKGMMLGSIKG